MSLDPIVRLCVVVLPTALAPMIVVRHDGVTMVHMDAMSRRWQLTAAYIDLMTPAELSVVKRAYGQPTEGPMEDWVVDDGPALLFVPAALRLCCAPALQGGAELERRIIAGEMSCEMKCVEAERVVAPVSVLT